MKMFTERPITTRIVLALLSALTSMITLIVAQSIGVDNRTIAIVASIGAIASAILAMIYLYDNGGGENG